MDGEEADGLVGAGEAAEVGDEDAAVAGVLISDESDGCSCGDGVSERVHGTELVDEDESSSAPDIADPLVEGFHVEGAVDGVHGESEEGHDVAEGFPVAAVPAEEEGRLSGDEVAYGAEDAVDACVSDPCVFGEEAWGVEDFDGELEEVLVGVDGDAFASFGRGIGERLFEVLDGASEAFAI